MIIPEDVKAYLEQAAIELAREDDFIPKHEEHMAHWIEANFLPICARASHNMRMLANKLAAPGVLTATANTLASQIWATINGKKGE